MDGERIGKQDHSTMRLGYLWRSLLTIAVSLLCAGLFYAVWLVAFIRAGKPQSSVVSDILWLLAPVITAAGFAAGIAIFERLTTPSRTNFLRIFLWPVMGSTIGALAVYWLGPMLIVFGMFVAGTASVALREAHKIRGNRTSKKSVSSGHQSLEAKP